MRLRNRTAGTAVQGSHYFFAPLFLLQYTFFTRREYNKFIPTSLRKETHCNQAIFIQFCKKKKPSVHCIICVICLDILILPLKRHLLIAIVPTRSVAKSG